MCCAFYPAIGTKKLYFCRFAERKIKNISKKMIKKPTVKSN